MQVWVIAIMVVTGIFLGFFVGIIFQKIRRHKEKSIGSLIVTDSEDNKEPPFIYLELHESFEIICSKRTVELKVRRVSHK